GPNPKWFATAPAIASSAPISISTAPQATASVDSVSTGSSNRRAPKKIGLVDVIIPSSTKNTNSDSPTSTCPSRNPSAAGSRRSRNRLITAASISSAATTTNVVSGTMNVSIDQAEKVPETPGGATRSPNSPPYCTNGANEKKNTSSVPITTSRSPIRASRGGETDWPGGSIPG